jgi:hypothetical protein
MSCSFGLSLALASFAAASWLAKVLMQKAVVAITIRQQQIDTAVDQL